MSQIKDPLLVNKILAAFLVGGLVIMGSGYLVSAVYHPSLPEKPSYAIAIPEATTADEKPKFPPLNERLRLVASLGDDTLKRGKSLFKKCKSCHTVNKGGKNGVGPNLWGIVNTTAGKRNGFSYSRKIGTVGAWSFENLDAFITRPSAFLKGTKMSFAGLRHPMERAAVLLYLNSLSENPAPLPQE